MKYLIQFVTIAAILFFAFSCSKNSPDPVSAQITEKTSGNLNSLPSMIQNGSTGTGLMGGFNLTISDDGTNAELTPLRTSSLGEAFIVSGEAYFKTFPCSDCLDIRGLGINNEGNIEIVFTIRHPFEKGDPSEPSSGKNRLDLDLFDVALLVRPVAHPKQNFPLSQADLYTDTILNADGFSGDLGDIMPYKICYESLNNNRFEMGTTPQEFTVIFPPSGHSFHLYLSMGYGVSATYLERFEPVYFVPEFNRKSAWKIVVSEETWINDDPSTVTIDIYDWNHGATVADTFPDEANTGHIRSLSDIESVTVEVLGMTSELVVAETIDTTSNGWDDPLTYTATFNNENELPNGNYKMLVKVVDSRPPGDAGQADSLVVTEDGKTLEFYPLTEIVTWQSSNATIVQEQPAHHWVKAWGGTERDLIHKLALDTNDNIYIAGEYDGEMDFDPGDGENLHSTPGVMQNGFLIKIDEFGELITYITWDSLNGNSCNDVKVGPDGYIYVCGQFAGDLDMDPGAGEDIHSSAGSNDAYHSKFDSYLNHLWSKSWGGTGYDRAIEGMVWADGTYVTGVYSGTVDFDPDPTGEDVHQSNGSLDVWVTKFQDGGILQWAKTFGGENNDEAMAIEIDPNDNIYLAGNFTGTVDFDPSIEVDEKTSVANSMDAFFLKFQSGGILEYSRTWGGDSYDEALDIEYPPIPTGGTIFIIAGYFSGEVDLDPGPGEDIRVSKGREDGQISFFDEYGELQRATTIGGTSYDTCREVVMKSSGVLVIEGEFSSKVDFDPGPGIEEKSSRGSSDVYMLELNSDCTFKSVNKWGGHFWDWAGSVVVDGSGNLVVGMEFTDEVEFDIGYIPKTTYVSNGSLDVGVLKFKP